MEALILTLGRVFCNLCQGAKEQLQKENEELKQQREELEVRVSALKSQYEGRLSRQERELRDLRGQQERQEQRDEPPEAGPSKVRVCFKVLDHHWVGQSPSWFYFRFSDTGAAEEHWTKADHSEDNAAGRQGQVRETKITTAVSFFALQRNAS